MTTIGCIHACVEDGALGIDLLIDPLHPCFLRVIVAVVELGILVAEVVVESLAGLYIESATARGCILHVDGRSTMPHQGSHCRCLRICIALGVAVDHVAPVVGCLAEICFIKGTVEGILVGTRSLCGVFPVVHDLCHGGSLATRRIMTGSHARAVIVIRSTLSPSRGNHRLHRLSVLRLNDTLQRGIARCFLCLQDLCHSVQPPVKLWVIRR